MIFSKSKIVSFKNFHNNTFPYCVVQIYSDWTPTPVNPPTVCDVCHDHKAPINHLFENRESAH